MIDCRHQYFSILVMIHMM